MRASTVWGDYLALLLITTLPAKVEILSEGMEDAGMANTWVASLARVG